MKDKRVSRCCFLRHSLALVGASAVAPLAASACAETSLPPAIVQPSSSLPSAIDLVPLGKTNHKISRLGLGTGSNNGQIQQALGQEGFNSFVR
ncbi:MAG: hypothetical protein MSG64_20420 [Pyrinomonadaceae bacterium MAG19_C2-C3]|nr:hypothetical protein [Pyrinomonadaceae bacterium MAG19_C2-C3]